MDDTYALTDNEEAYDFEYSEEDSDSNAPQQDSKENIYYSAKQAKAKGDTTAAIEILHGLSEREAEKEGEKTEWGFKALKQQIKINFHLQNYDTCIQLYPTLLQYTKNVVTKNASEKSINSILDVISTANNPEFMEAFYNMSLTALEEQKNERLLLKTNLKLAKVWLDKKQFNKLSDLLQRLHAALDNEKNSSAERKASTLLEIHAVAIQMYTETKNNQMLKTLYNECLTIKSAIPHPKTMAIIRECGGKMHMNEKEWLKAQTDFFEAFRNYDESGDDKRISCLKYLVLTSMLMESAIDPFESQETKPHKNNVHLIALTSLVHAYQRQDIVAFEDILAQNRSQIMEDPFICIYIEEVLRAIRSQVLVNLLRPYSRVSLPYVAEYLKITLDEVESLLMSLIQDSRLDGRLNQQLSLYEMDYSLDNRERYDAITTFAGNVTKMCESMGNCVRVPTNA